MSNPAYPSDFVGKLEFFDFKEEPSGYREEHWLSDRALIRVIWFPSNDRELPNTMIYQYF